MNRCNIRGKFDMGLLNCVYSFCHNILVEFDVAGKLRENHKAATIVEAVVVPRFISGPVAQLGARFHGMEEVVGSIPTRSTKLPQHLPASVFPLWWLILQELLTA
jgi:hypothetical protein